MTVAHMIRMRLHRQSSARIRSSVEDRLHIVGQNLTSDQTGQLTAKMTSLGDCMEPMVASSYFRLVNTMPHSASAAPAAW